MLESGARVHLIGICGTAMASLAGLLQSRGFKVTGSDANPYPPMSTQLQNLGIPIMNGYRAENLNPKPDFVIVGNVVSKTNPEAVELLKLGVPYTSLPKALGEWIIEDRACVCVSGTHGKTTTTSLLAWLTDQGGLKPGFLIGGIPLNFSQSFRNPEGELFVIEGDEYDTAFFDKVPKFVHYRPRHVILTSLEFDHADIYQDLEEVKTAFRKLLRLIPEEGSLIYWSEESSIREILAECKTKNIYSYGFSDHAQFRVEVISSSGEEQKFRIFHEGKVWGEFHLGLSGRYNALNAAAALIQGAHLGISQEQLGRFLRTFRGVKRRQEIRGEPRGILIVEDFAHHPTAVRETLQGIVQRYQGRRIHAVFEPRSATSRRKIFQKDYGQAFGGAHRVYLAEAFDQSKISEEDRFSSEDLAKDLQKKNQKAEVYKNAQQIVEALKKNSEPGDVILLMSNGGFDNIYEKLLTALST